MNIRKIGISQFRNYAYCSVEFSPEFNWVSGANGQGKTNLVEAVYYLCNLESFRAGRPSQLLRISSSEAIISAEVEQKSVLHSVRLNISKKGRRVFLDHRPFRRVSEYILSFMALAFTPEDVNLFRNAPHERRKFFNRILSFTNPAYFKNLQEYSKILIQKNFLLKQQSTEQIPLWNEMLARSGVQLMKHRQQFVEQVNLQLGDLFKALSGRSEKLELIYNPSLKLSSFDEYLCRRQLEKNLSGELQYGYSALGPHRDEYHLLLDDKADRDFFSQGEFRITNLSLKMTINQLFYQKYQFYPVLIFDDLFSELDDEVNQQILRFFLSLKNQIFITSTSAPSHSLSGNLFHVVDGELV